MIMVHGPLHQAWSEGFWYFQGWSSYHRNGIMENISNIQKSARIYYHLALKFNQAVLIILQTNINYVNSLRFRL